MWMRCAVRRNVRSRAALVEECLPAAGLQRLPGLRPPGDDLDRKPPVYCGVDLAASPRRPTGLGFLAGSRIRTYVVHDDAEILRRIFRMRPRVVLVDAPLSLPPGRKSPDDRSGGHFRPCDLALRRRGIRFFPVTLGAMRRLTERGLALARELRKAGFLVHECFPGGAQDLLGLPRQHRDRVGLVAGLRRLGLRGLRGDATGDELDAATAALVAKWFDLGRARLWGGRRGIVMPS
ncbi:MAG: nuclease [Candidatus Binatia bacterium]|nr:MAG: nuclease [Candidatus Binatia bacterium]